MERHTANKCTSNLSAKHSCVFFPLLFWLEGIQKPSRAQRNVKYENNDFRAFGLAIYIEHVLHRCHKQHCCRILIFILLLERSWMWCICVNSVFRCMCDQVQVHFIEYIARICLDTWHSVPHSLCVLHLQLPASNVQHNKNEYSGLLSYDLI